MANGENNQPESLDDKKYQNPELRNVDVPQAPSSKDQKEMQKVREKLDDLKKFIISKFKFVNGIGIIPPQAAEIFDEENELSEDEKKEKPMHLLVVLSDDKEKEFNQVKIEIVKKIKEDKLKIWFLACTLHT